MIIVLDPYLYGLIRKDVTVGWLRKEIKEDMDKLSREHIEKRALLRKYTGQGELKGILDYVPEDTTVTSADNINFKNVNDDFVIGPLNSDMQTEFYEKAIKNNKSVYPFTHPLLGNKHFRNIMFGEFAPKSVYVPDNSIDNVDVNEVKRLLKDVNVENVIIKDESGYHSGYLVPYRLTNINHLEDALKLSLRDARRLDIGEKGLVVEEFLAGTKSTVYKNHIFGEFIRDEVLEYEVTLSGLEGILKDYKNGKDLLVGVKSRTIPSNEDIIKKLEPIVRKNIPYALTSVDYIIKDDKPIVIDSNSIAGSLGEVQEINKNNNHNPFEFFVNKCIKYPKDEYKKQEEYLKILTKKSQKLRSLEGIVFVN